MGRLIDIDEIDIEKVYKQDEVYYRNSFRSGVASTLHYLAKMPTVDAVSKGLFDQIKWERDVAIGQLNEIGCELGQKMDDVSSVVRCGDCKYWRDDDEKEVMICGGEVRYARCGQHFSWLPSKYDFCSCGERKEE